MTTQQHRISTDNEATTHCQPYEVIFTWYKNISEIIMLSLPDGEMATHGRALGPKRKQQGDKTKKVDRAVLPSVGELLKIKIKL